MPIEHFALASVRRLGDHDIDKAVVHGQYEILAAETHAGRQRIPYAYHIIVDGRRDLAEVYGSGVIDTTARLITVDHVTTRADYLAHDIRLTLLPV